MGNVVEFKVYQIVKLNGVDRLACRVGRRWILDRTCESINEMLDNRLITLSAVNGWIQAMR